MNQKRIVIVGGGFAGVSCAERLIGNQDVHVTLIDKNNYHKFTPLLYQVATSALSTEVVATSLRQYFKGHSSIDIKMSTVTAVNPATKTVMTEEGESYTGDILVLAAGAVVNFFNTSGAEQYSFPLYTLVDAEKLRSRILAVFESADRDPRLIDRGVLNFVIVGAGPTGTETAGAIADMLHLALPKEFSDLAVKQAQVHLVDHSLAVLAPFSKESQTYAAEVLTRRGVHLHLGVLVHEVHADHVVLSNGNTIPSCTVIWAGGLKAPLLAEKSGLPQGHGGRINVLSDFSVQDYPDIFVLGDLANIPGSDGKPLPQLASVAKQSGEWAAKNIAARLNGKATSPFEYVDKGIMAMVGRNAAIAEIGEKRHQMKGFFAYVSWLTVHAALLSTWRQKMGATIAWAWDYFGHTEALQILDREDSAHID